MKPTNPKIPAVNFHFIKACNMKCRYCFAEFKQSKLRLPLEKMQEIIRDLADFGFTKINFVGGEPLLYKNIEELIILSKELGFYTSLVTNGTFLEEKLPGIKNHLDMIGISIDSLHPETNKKIGRYTRKGFAPDETYYRNLCNLIKINNIQLKINTVISQYNLEEDFGKFIMDVNPVRWKVFQVLGIEGENDITDSRITVEEFQGFIERHSYIPSLIAESNDLMQGSYVMIDPEGRFYDNTTGAYTKSDPIYKVGVPKALSQINMDYSKFLQRNGDFYNKQTKQKEL